MAIDLTPMQIAGRCVIEGYGGGGFRISGKRFEGAVIVLREAVLPWLPTDPRVIEPADLRPFADIIGPGRPDIVLLGCGPRFVLASPALRAGAKALGLGIDSMDTGAACRTFNVLNAEDRRVAAALLPID